VDSVNDGIDPELVDEGLPDDLRVVARTERVGQADRCDAQRERLAVVRHDLCVLRHERPRDASAGEDPTEDVRPRPADRIGVHPTLRRGRGRR
jgi:hypothetical protein